jgi:HEAT repeat protein
MQSWIRSAGLSYLCVAMAGRAVSQSVSTHAKQDHVADLIAQVRAADPRATLTAKSEGPTAAPGLVPLTHDPDAQVREIALLCLAETGGAPAVPAFLDRLGDSEPVVRATAMRGLARRAVSSDVPAMLDAARHVDDPVARAALVVQVARVGAAADRPALAHVCSSWHDDESTLGCVTALAWLGDESAQRDFANRLITSRDRARLRYLEYAEQIRAAWLLAALAEVLSDTDPVRWIGVDGGPPPETLRACDIAVNLIAAITGHGFTFAVSPRRNYPPAEIAEVRAFVARAH